LTAGDAPSFWRDGCGLPLGPSYELALLVKEIKGKSRVSNRKVMLFSVSQILRALSNRLTLWQANHHHPTIFVRLEFLYKLLWGKEDSLRSNIFRAFALPLLNTDTNIDTNSQKTVSYRPRKY
jgi:hypothetical protein